MIISLKIRLDSLLVDKGLASGRDRAKALIMSGIVYVGGQKAVKPGAEVPEDCDVEVRGETLRYVSRGGLKLEKAMEVFPLQLDGFTCMDIGASTGGFTDCMLQNGAEKVFAVDVGYGQLAWKLRSDDRVVVMERTNIRNVTPEQIGDPLDFASIDVSFISLALVLPVAWQLLKENGSAVCLVKPQFEAGRDKVGKKGVIRDPAVHTEVLERVCATAKEIGFTLAGLDFSPVKGPEGNIEYLLYLQKASGNNLFDSGKIQEVVEASHRELNAR